MSMLFKRIKDWATSITAFRTGDVIPVDGPSGTAKMTKDNLLKEASQNVLSGNVVAEFDPTRTSDNQYLAGDAVSYNGKKYVFKTNHYGAWSSSDVYHVSESLFSVESSYKILPNTYYYDSGSVSTFTNDYDMLAYVRVKSGDVLTINVGAPGCYVKLYTESGEPFDYFSFASSVERTVQVNAYANKVPHHAMIPISKTARSSAFVKINGNLVFDGKSNETLQLVATDIQGGQFQNIYFEGNDTTFASNRFHNKLVAGHRYRAYLLCSDFTATGSDPTDYKLILRPLYSDGTFGSALFICRVNDAASPYYDFAMPDNTYGVLFGGRAAKGKLVAMNLVDLSIPEYINSAILSSKVTLSKTLINSSVSGGYPDHDDSATRVCCTDIVLFPKSGKTTYKLTAPTGIQFSAAVFTGAQNVQTSYVIGWKSDGAVFEFDTETTHCYAFRPSFRRYDNSEITAAEVLQFIEEGKLYIEIVGENDLDYSATQNFNAVSSARKKLITSSPWCKELATIAHISDIHGDVTRLRNARKIADLFGVDALVNSGDSVMYSGAARADFLKEYSSETIPLIFCIGNHEAFPNGSATQASLIADYITPLAVQNGYKKNSTDVADSAYYFRDLSEKKIRLVAINYYNNGVYNGSLGQSQLDWFVQTLASTPQDYGVIVVVHSPEDKIICPENLQTFYQKERVVSYQENGFYIGNRPVMQIIDAFISKTSGVETYTSEADGEVSVAYDFTSLNSGVEFICYMTGHRHEDWVGYYNNATNKQLSLGITTGCALNSMYNNTAWNNQSDLGKNGGSGPSQDAVNIYAIDRDAGAIRIVRIGANITTSLEERSVLIIPYRD